MGWLEGKTALITGGGSGIGRAVVERFIAEGAQVGVLERFQERVDEVNSAFGSSVRAVQGDVTNYGDNERAIAETVRAFGKLDIFIGNAGIFDAQLFLADIEKERLGAAFDEMYNINVKGYLFGAKAAVPELQKTGGCMVFTASPAGLSPVGGGILYVTSKHAVVGLIHRLAYELAPDIRVNGVAPGGVATDLRGPAALNMADQYVSGVRRRVEEAKARGETLKLGVQAEDVAGAYVYLASEENSRAVTGVIIPTPGSMGTRGQYVSQVPRPQEAPAQR